MVAYVSIAVILSNLFTKMKDTDLMKYGLKWYGCKMKLIPLSYLVEILPNLTKKEQPLINYINERLKKI